MTIPRQNSLKIILAFALLGLIILAALFYVRKPIIAPEKETVLPSPTELIKPSQRPITPTYTCPASDYVDCMPILAPEKQYLCEKDYLSWAIEHCPGFKGGAY